MSGVNWTRPEPEVNAFQRGTEPIADSDASHGAPTCAGSHIAVSAPTPNLT